MLMLNQKTCSSIEKIKIFLLSCRVLIPASQDNRSLARILLSVPTIQPHIQQMLLEKLPEHFNDTSTQESLSLKDDIARLIINQFRWLDFLVDPTGFAEKLMEMLSVAPSRMKREIVGLLPEIVGDQSCSTVLPALEGLLNEDSELVVPVLDALSDLNLDEQLQEQVHWYMHIASLIFDINLKDYGTDCGAALL